VLFIAPRAAKPATLKRRSMNLQEFIDCARRLPGVKALDYPGIGVARTLSLATQNSERLHIHADGLCCHACTMHAPYRLSSYGIYRSREDRGVVPTVRRSSSRRASKSAIFCLGSLLGQPFRLGDKNSGFSSKARMWRNAAVENYCGASRHCCVAGA
jgi:hypothetical protein